MTDLVLVRHAATVWHKEDRYTGASDVALAPEGRDQAERLAAWAKRACFDGVWTSPLIRCRQTAAPSVAAAGLPEVVDARLRELDFGCLEGRTKAEARILFADAMESFLRDPVANHFADGEPPRSAAARTTACLKDIASAHPEGRILVVAHSTVIRLALCTLLGIDLSHYRTRFPRLLNCAITHVRLSGDEASLISLNLPVELLHLCDGEMLS